MLHPPSRVLHELWPSVNIDIVLQIQGDQGQAADHPPEIELGYWLCSIELCV